MCKLKSNILAFLCFLGAINGFLHAESSVVLRPSADALCTANPFITLSQVFTDEGYFGDSHLFMYEYSSDGISWSRIPFTHKSPTWGYSQRPVNLSEGWYRVLVAREDELEQPDKWIVSEPVYMEKIEGGCTPYKYTWPDEISEDVCPQGAILFLEDFGGNDPSDPVTSSQKLVTMSSKYRQQFDVQRTSPSSGKFVVAKHGWQNSLQTSMTDCMYTQWFIQDDHTYPNDYTRGYVLEVDGRGGNDAFYTITLPVCHDLDLSFSAYVANVLEPGHNFARPKVRFLIQNDLTNDTIWEQSSGAIEPAPADYRQYGLPTTMSAPWHLVGAIFHVPEGAEMIRLSIFNDEDNDTGNDFAMDDIEIRLCNSAVSILSEHEICMDSSYTFVSSVTADGGFKEPYNYLWQYAPDSLDFNSEGWTNVILGETLSFDKVKLTDEGWYRLCVTSAGVDVETERYCRAMSEPFHLTVNDCTPPWYPIIVNKYNWQLLCDNVALRRLFPDNMPIAFQWYKNGQPVSGATEDDYAEQNELHGQFQLCVTMDDEEIIWSNIIDLSDFIEEIPVQVHIYNTRGEEVSERHVTQGVYLYRYQQGDRIWTIKRFIP